MELLKNILDAIRGIKSDKEEKAKQLLSAERDLSSIDIERKKIERKFDGKDRELVDSFEDNKKYWGDTDSEQMVELERRRGLIQENRNYELQELDNKQNYHEKFIKEIEKSRTMDWIKNNKIKLFLSLAILGYIFLYITDTKILISEKRIRVGESYFVEDWGNIENANQDSLVCKYFNGRRILNRVFWYSPDNLFGRDSCSFLLHD